jgi:malonyl-CoA O-methyltransferase
VTVLSARDGYRLWAEQYDQETPVSLLENTLVRELAIPVAGRRLLDAGCGTARRLQRTGASLAVGADQSPEMLAQAEPGPGLVAAELRSLPFPAASFDVVWCRLVIGHLKDLRLGYQELARVCRPGGSILLSDFHPEAAAAGDRRSFRAVDGTVYEIEHHVHPPEAHQRLAADLGLRLRARRDGEVGPLIRPLYEAAGRLDAYQAQLGLRLILVLAFTKGG